MGAITELSPQIDAEVRTATLRIYRLGREAVDVPFHELPATSRALSLAKESPQYQAWLVKQGLA